MTRHIFLLKKSWSFWNTRFSESLEPKRCGVKKLFLQILSWCMIFRVNFLWRKKELLAAKVLRIFPQTPPYRTFWTTWICHTLPLSSQQLSIPRDEIADGYLQLISLNPEQEAPSATASQHRDHTAYSPRTRRP